MLIFRFVFFKAAKERHPLNWAKKNINFFLLFQICSIFVSVNASYITHNIGHGITQHNSLKYNLQWKNKQGYIASNRTNTQASTEKWTLNTVRTIIHTSILIIFGLQFFCKQHYSYNFATDFILFLLHIESLFVRITH